MHHLRQQWNLCRRWSALFNHPMHLVMDVTVRQLSRRWL